MSDSKSQPKLRASVFYLGSALFLATALVGVADQPIPLNSQNTHPACGCNQAPPVNCRYGTTCTYYSPCYTRTCIIIEEDKKFYAVCTC
jgi:hypothetical protein